MAFSLLDYQRLLASLKHLSSKNWLTVTQAAQADSSVLNRALIMRHDVDRSPKNALAMARLERRYDVPATYYFRCNQTGRFPDRYIRAIAALGHEVGYHYECLSRCKGDKAKALIQFTDHLKQFRMIAPCSSVAMHGAPLSPHCNQDLLIGQDLSDYDLVADAVLSFSCTTLSYFTDTGGRWNASGRHNLRDRVGLPLLTLPSPDDSSFSCAVKECEQPVIISTHPERWAINQANYAIILVRDFLSNTAKDVLRVVRKGKV